MTKFPVAFSSSVVQRALGKKFDDFCEAYEGAKLIRRSSKPTDLQFEVAEYAKKNGNKAACKKFKMANYRVYASVNSVARYNWLNN